MSLVLNVEILGEFRNLTKATQGSQSELSKLNGKIGSFSKSAKAAFASIGVGLSFALIARELGEATKAAVEDRKSQELLANQLENTTGATKSQIATVEKQIGKLQLSASVADDKLRPAFAQFTRVTGETTEAMKLLNLATEVSAGSGKSLEAVTAALSKAYGGKMAALTKLGIPMSDSIQNASDYSREMQKLTKLQNEAAGLTGPALTKAMEKVADQQQKVNDIAARGIDWQGDLSKAFAGSAAAAANTDPYQRLQIIFGEIQEKVGTALLPALDEISAWLASPGGTEALKLASDAIVQILKDAVAVAKWATANKDWLLPLATGIGLVTAAWKVATAGVAAYNAVAAIAAGLSAAGGVKAGAGAVAGKIAPLLPALGVAGSVGAVLSLGGDTQKGTKAPLAPTSKTAPSWTGGTNLLTPQKTASGITINVSQAVTAQTIIDTVSAYQRSTGTSLAQALR